MSASVSHLTNDLISFSVPTDQQAASYTVSTRPSQSKEHLRSIWASLTPPLSQTRINETINALQQYESSQARIAAVQAADEEEKTLKIAIAGRLVVGLYAEALDTFLKEASEAESEAEWWADIERSSLSVAYYLVQTLPARLLNLARTIFSAIQSQNRAFNTSAFAITSLRGFFSGRNIGHPNSLAALLFPHLHRHPHAMPLSFSSFKISAFSLQPPPLFPSTNDVVSGMNNLSSALIDFYYSLLAAVALPVELTRQEVRVKRQELQQIRDERAEVLGELVDKREQLEQALLDKKSGSADERQLSFLHELDQTIADRAGDATLMGLPPSLVATLDYVSSTLLPQHVAEHAEHLRTHGLLKPSRLVLLWPRLVLLPPLGLYAIKQLYASQDSLIAMGQDVWATVKGFWHGWLVEPMKDIVKTVRAGGDEGMIVNKESVDADLQSLERMALDLAREKLHYSPTQLNELSAKIRVGDLTPILQIYEDDIKSPVRSAIGGTLLRSLFVQVQKAKVDIDQALAGIDKLLKSQELTFAFVGVAPALAIVYVTGGSLRNLWTGGKGRGRFGGKKRRAAVWQAMRRVERLLVSKPRMERYRRGTAAGWDKHAIPPLTSGLLLLSVSSLRGYGEAHLPLHSRLREGFLEDVGDLEDPTLDRDEKIRVVERMWRSWGSILEWERAGGTAVS